MGLLRKIALGEAPDLLRDLIPLATPPKTKYSLRSKARDERHGHTLKLETGKDLEPFRRSFMHDGVIAFNSLPPETLKNDDESVVTSSAFSKRVVELFR